ncbi:MAG TPA: 4-hydroxythreonine-4-phosphate dehydrogenase, partial [Pseudolabrys sp.]|nr:4-hydroxythreonine-4-phosphate dehydrogenase [Pseudolabrys sp.]
MNPTTPPLALTLGEPAGIGPDIALIAWSRRDEFNLPPFYLIGDKDFVGKRAAALKLDVPVKPADPEDAVATFSRALPLVP